MIKIVGTPGKILLDQLKSISVTPEVVDYPIDARPSDVLLLVDPAQIQWVKALQLKRRFQLVVIRDQDRVPSRQLFQLLGMFLREKNIA